MEKVIKTPELVMLVGIPASGKSTACEQFNNLGYLILSSDKLRFEFAGTEDVYNFEEKELNKINSQVFEHIKMVAHRTLKKGQSVVIDATNLSRKKRRLFLKNFRDVACQKRCIVFITPVYVCRARNDLREYPAKVPSFTISNMLRNFEVPCYQEGWDYIDYFACDKPYQFPFDKTADFSQDNPHHTLTLGGHLEKAKSYAIENGYSDTLIKLCYYHDIGKLYTKRFKNSVGEDTAIAHFYGHENYSAYLYLCECVCGKNLNKAQFDEVLYETLLINCHMRPLNRWQGKPLKKQKDKEFFGEEFFEDLIKINLADRFAH